MKMRNRMVVLTLALAVAWSGLELYSGGDAYARVCFLVGGCRDPKTRKLEKVPTTNGTETGGTTIGVNDKDCSTLGYEQCGSGRVPAVGAQSCTKNGQTWYSECACDIEVFPYKYASGDMSADRPCALCCRERCPRQCSGPQWNLSTPYTGVENQGCEIINNSEICHDANGSHHKHKICKAGYKYVASASDATFLASHGWLNPATVPPTPSAYGWGMSCDEKYDLRNHAVVHRYADYDCYPEYKYTEDDIPSDAFAIDTTETRYCQLESGSERKYLASARKCSGKVQPDGTWKSTCGSNEYSEDSETWDGLTCHLCRQKCDTSTYPYKYGDDMGSEQSTRPGAMLQSPTDRAKPYTGAGETCVDDEGTHYQHKVCKKRFKYRLGTGTGSSDAHVASALQADYFNEVSVCSYGLIGGGGYCDEKYDLVPGDWGGSVTSVRRYTTCECQEQYKYEEDELPTSTAFSSNSCTNSEGETKYAITCSGAEEDGGTWWRQVDVDDEFDSSTQYIARTETKDDVTCYLVKEGCNPNVYKYMYGDDMGAEQSTMPGAMQQSPIERAKKYTGAGETCTDSAGTHYQYKICKARYSYALDPGNASQLNNIRNALNTGAHHAVGTWCVYGSKGNYDYCDDKYDLNTQTGTSSVRRYTDCVEPSYYGN